MSSRVTIFDGTSWANPFDSSNRDAMYRVTHSLDYNREDVVRVLALAEGYIHLMTHPAMTLSEAARRISGVRRAVK